MLRGARVIAIDDQKKDLDGIVEALQRKGVGVLPFLYRGKSSLRRCHRGVRIVFADINILPSAAAAYQQHQAVAAVLDILLAESNGPWVLVAWTASPGQVQDLERVLKESLGRGRAPVASIGLDKPSFLTPQDTFKIAEIAQALENQIAQDPVANAIIDLEMRAADAAHDVINTIMTISKTASAPDIARVLVAMSVATDASGSPKPERVFQTLGPVFQDRLIRRGVRRAERTFWNDAFTKGAVGKLEESQRAALNNAIHLDPVVSAGDRGALTPIPASRHKLLEKAVHAPLDSLVFKHFLSRDRAISTMRKATAAEPAPPGGRPPPPPPEVLADQFLAKMKWALMEVAAACDASNDKRGLRRSAVALLVPAALGPQTGAGEYVEALPLMQFGSERLYAYVSAKITLSPLPKGLARLKPSVRVRDQLLDGLAQTIAVSQSRLGWVNF